MPRDLKEVLGIGAIAEGIKVSSITVAIEIKQFPRFSFDAFCPNDGDRGKKDGRLGIERAVKVSDPFLE